MLFNSLGSFILEASEKVVSEYETLKQTNITPAYLDYVNSKLNAQKFTEDDDESQTTLPEEKFILNLEREYCTTPNKFGSEDGKS